uniref:Fucosyltransferase n=1 Tax=Elaeophora elaphi TaxID=1147741 RepID=A0A0R3RZA6_9BILA
MEHIGVRLVIYCNLLSISHKENKPLIVAWTTYFKENWAPLLKQEASSCAYECLITDDKEQLSKDTTVLFHIRDLKQSLPESRNPEQLFVFMLQESPLYTFNYLNFVPKDYFNITMTYRRDSDVYIPYGVVENITDLTPPELIWNWNEVMEIASGKVQPVLQLVSNCRTRSKRELYVKQLQKHINVTRYGACNKNVCDRECEIREAARHRFYLAFENSICRDYITEKLFKCLIWLIVPVVLKKSIYEDVLPPGSFIAADDFTSPRELAEYLQYLSINNTAYLSYLKWTKYYQKIKYVSNYCELCKYLHGNTAKSQVIPNIRKWWFQGCINRYALKLLENTVTLKTKKQ